MEMTVIEQDLKDNSSFNISAISAVDPDTVSYKIHIFSFFILIFNLYPRLKASSLTTSGYFSNLPVCLVRVELCAVKIAAIPFC